VDPGKEIGSPLTIINNFVGFKVLIELGKDIYIRLTIANSCSIDFFKKSSVLQHFRTILVGK
uniref:Uncharacterized protein n=1 Tax=Romanomermis culicivorax TaxID=13658 RepID=A0A915JVW1_ROMCU